MRLTFQSSFRNLLHLGRFVGSSGSLALDPESRWVQLQNGDQTSDQTRQAQTQAHSGA